MSLQLCKEFLKFIVDCRGRAKWSAWDEKKATNADEAKSAYIAKYEELLAKYGKA